MVGPDSIGLVLVGASLTLTDRPYLHLTPTTSQTSPSERSPTTDVARQQETRPPCDHDRMQLNHRDDPLAPYSVQCE